jgi:hypothetical protein
VPGSYEGRHEDPFRNRRAVDSAGGCERDVGVFDDPMVCPGVDAGRKEMYKLDAAMASYVRYPGSWKKDGGR